MDLKRRLRIRCRRRTRSGQTLTTDIAENQKPRTTLLLDQLKEVAADLLRRPIRAGDGIALKRWQCTSRYTAQNSGPSGSLLLSRRNLSFPASCRFIPAHRTGQRAHRALQMDLCFRKWTKALLKCFHKGAS
jgi:hypothetical protein